MRILFVCDTYYPHVNGVYVFVRELAQELQKQQHSVAVIAPSQTIHYEEKIIDNILVYCMPSMANPYYKSIRIPLPFKLKSRLKNIISQFDPEIIHLQNHFLLNKAIVEVNRSLSIPVVATNHFMAENLTFLMPSNSLKKLMAWWLWKGFVKVFRHASVVTTPTKFGVRLIASKLPTQVIDISNGIDLNKYQVNESKIDFRKKYNLPVGKILLSVGRLDPEKCTEEVLNAISSLLKEVEFSFLIVGKGLQMEKLKSLATKLGIIDKVIFTGFVPDVDLPYVYNLADVFITASIAELQSIVTMEAMASGLPIIAKDSGALNELVTHGENGFLVKANEISSISKYLSDLISDDDLMLKMGRKSRDMIKKHDLPFTVQRFKELYRSLEQ